MTAPIPFHLSHIRKISKDYLETGSIPIFPRVPSWSSDIFCQEIGKKFGLSNVHLSMSPSFWEHYSKISTRYHKLKVVPITISSLPEACYLLFDLNNWQDLILSLLSHKEADSYICEDPTILEALSTYVLLQHIRSFSLQEEWKSYLIQLADPSKIIEEEQLVLSREINLSFKEDLAITCHLVFSEKFVQSWNQHSIQKNIPQPNIDVDIPLKINVGHVTLYKSDWNQVQPGDFICLDQGNFAPDLKKGDVFLTTHGRMIAKGSLEKNTISKIRKE